MKRVNVIITLLAGILVIGSSCANHLAGNGDNSSSNMTSASSQSSVSNTQNANTELQGADEGPEEAYPAESEDSGDEGYNEAVNSGSPMRRPVTA